MAVWGNPYERLRSLPVMVFLCFKSIIILKIMITKIIFFIVFILLAVFAVSLLKKYDKENRKESIYKKRESVMNKSESAFFFELQKQLPNGYHIFPKMRIADIIETESGKGYYKLRDKILPK